MSDDQRPSRRDPDDFSEFGSLFEDSPPTENIEQVSEHRPEPIDDGWAQRTSEQPEVGTDRSVADPDSFRDYDHGAGYEGLADDGGRVDDPAVEAIEQHDDAPEAGVDDSGSIRFDDESGSMPHWTEPPTGEVPRLEPRAAADEPLEDDEVDVWSTFSSESPVWKDDAAADQPAVDPRPSGRTSAQSPLDDQRHADTREQSQVSGPVGRVSGPQSRVTGPQTRVTGQHDAVTSQPNRITIGTDPSGMPRREPPGRGRGRGRNGPPSRRQPVVRTPGGADRDLPTAIAVGLLLAAAFIGALITDQRLVVALVTIVVGLASVEFYGRVTEKGYRPANAPGVAMCIAAPLAAYWIGDAALPLVVAFGFMACAVSFAGAHSVESGPLPNASVTTVGMVWIGLLGSFAMLILRFSTANGSGLDIADNWGTDTLFLLALGVVANDVGALAVGSAAGRTPLRPWISPNKTVEGLIGGTGLTVAVLVVVGVANLSDTWSSTFHLLLLGLVISAMAPMGDIVESMFKRNLDVKDFGTIVRGHGGVLDRFDGFLFVLPAVYYLTLVLEPWTKYGG